MEREYIYYYVYNENDATFELKDTYKIIKTIEDKHFCYSLNACNTNNFLEPYIERFHMSDLNCYINSKLSLSESVGSFYSYDSPNTIKQKLMNAVSEYYRERAIDFDKKLNQVTNIRLKSLNMKFKDKANSDV